MTSRFLQSRFGGGLARSTTVITYRGRTSGRLLSTPVEDVRDGSRVTILVAAADGGQAKGPGEAGLREAERRR